MTREDTELNAQLHAEQVRIVYQHIKPGIFASVFNASLLVVLQWPVIDHSILLAWYTFSFVTGIARYALVLAYERARPSIEQSHRWGQYFISGAAVSGSTWGLAATILLPASHPVQEMLTVLVLAGTTAGATATLSAQLRAFVIFSLFSLLPLLAHQLYIGGLMHNILAAFTIIFLLFMLISARRNNEILLTSLRLNFENQGLLQSLEHEKQQAINLNDNLKKEIGQRLEAEQQLRGREQSLEEAQRIAGLGNWECDQEFHQLNLSREMQYLMGLTDNPRDYASFLAAIDAEDRAMVEASRNNALRQGKDYLVEYRVPLSGHRFRILEEQGIVRRDHGGASIGLSVIALDVTQRREMDRLKREFISVVSHELRTPLTAITGTLSLLEGGIAGAMPDKAKELVSVAHRNSERLGKLVNDILDIDKLEFGELPLEAEDIDVLTLVETAIEENTGYADKLGVSLKLEPSAKGITIHGDRDRLIQVVTNLLSNAAKYSPQGDTVEVGIHPGAQTVRITVSDHGPGIAESFQERVFQKFAQGDTSDSRYQYGTGLGLNIAKLIVEKHGGHIGFDTRIHQGTTFWFELPSSPT